MTTPAAHTGAPATTGAAITGAAITPLDGDRLRRVVAVLCFTEIVSWGVLFYAFPVMVATIGDSEGWPLANLMAAFTLAQVVAAAAGVWVGHRIDRHGPHLVMTAGSVLGIIAVLALSAAPTQPMFFAAFILVGLAISATLYAPAFTAITHWAEPQARVKALTAVTLIAGLASTVFAPLTALMLDHLTWRQTYAALTVALASTVIAHAAGLRHPWRTHATGATHPLEPHESATSTVSHLRSSTTTTGFVPLVVAFTLAGFAAYAVVVNLVPMLTSRGFTTNQAALALGIGGIGQVAGRLTYNHLTRRFSVRGRTALVLAGSSLTIALLAIPTDVLALAAIAAFAAGIVRGLFTLLQATAVPDRWGTHAYGARTSVLTGATMTATAFAPWLGALLAHTTNGWTGALLVLAAVAALATGLTGTQSSTTTQP